MKISKMAKINADILGRAFVIANERNVNIERLSEYLMCTDDGQMVVSGERAGAYSSPGYLMVDLANNASKDKFKINNARIEIPNKIVYAVGNIYKSVYEYTKLNHTVIWERMKFKDLINFINQQRDVKNSEIHVVYKYFELFKLS